WLNSFERIYICFDNDEPGQKAAKEVASLFDFNKIYYVKLTKYKDANEYLTEGDPSEFVRVWHNSKRYMIEGVVSSFEELDAIIDKVRFLASACDCKYIFLDHITMVVTGLLDADQTKLLDYLSTKLDMLVQSLNFGLIFVSHVNDDGKTRGSRNISKIAHTW